jgi:hypothetical protein
MAERSTAKPKRREGGKASQTVAADPAGGEEVARLKAELEAARARIAELEAKHAEIINRIDWVIDSLHNLTE